MFVVDGVLLLWETYNHPKLVFCICTRLVYIAYNTSIHTDCVAEKNILYQHTTVDIVLLLTSTKYPLYSDIYILKIPVHICVNGWLGWLVSSPIQTIQFVSYLRPWLDWPYQLAHIHTIHLYASFHIFPFTIRISPATIPNIIVINVRVTTNTHNTSENTFIYPQNSAANMMDAVLKYSWTQ